MLIMVWLQTAEISTRYISALTIFVGILAFSLFIQAIAFLWVARKVVTLLTDVKHTFDETKGRTLPILAKIADLTHVTQGIVSDLAPKIKVVSENVVEVSHTVRQTASKLDTTIRDAADQAAVTFGDANSRTKVQVARVDGMIASTLAATAELGATVNEGIRVPARKIAVIVTQAKHMVETLVDRAKALGVNVSGARTQSESKTPQGRFKGPSKL